jgi:hypothetical protein
VPEKPLPKKFRIRVSKKSRRKARPGVCLIARRALMPLFDRDRLAGNVTDMLISRRDSINCKQGQERGRKRKH